MPRKSRQAIAAEPQYPIKVTALQRDALLHCTRLRKKVKDRLKDVPEGTQVVSFSKQELDHMLDELGEAAVFLTSPHKKRIVAVQKKVVDILDELQLESRGAESLEKRRRPTAKSDLLFQFKITLLNIKPPIWRRIQVRNCTLGDLHEYVQDAMGWWNDHLHQFEIDGKYYGQSFPNDLDFGLETIDEEGVTLSDLLPKSGKKARWVYVYDLGDEWRTKSSSRAIHPSKSGQNTRSVSKESEPVPQRTVAGRGASLNILKSSLIRSTNTMTRCSNGEGRSIQNYSMRKKRLRR